MAGASTGSPADGAAPSVLVVVAAALGAVVWGLAVFFATEEEGEPGGRVFSLYVLFVAAYIGGRLAPLAGMPPLLGMMVVGFALRNVPGDLLRDFDDDWASVLRSVCLTVILLRAGLGLNIDALRRLGAPTLRLAFIPVLFEATTVAMLTFLIFDFPIEWCFLLGFVLTAVSPAVVVPSLLSLQRQGYGVVKGIPTMLLGAAGLDDVVAISGFGAFLGVVFSEGSLAMNILRGPIELVAGLAVGLALGLGVFWLRDAERRLRTAVTLGLGLACLMGGRYFEATGAGALGTMCFTFVAAQFWGPGLADETAADMAGVWKVAEPVLFSLIGAAVQISDVTPSDVWRGLIVIALASILRCLVTHLCVLGAGFRAAERMFVTFAWLPKATVQAAIGSVALDTARDRNAGQDDIDRGETVLTLAVLIILITAPIGAVLIAWFGPKWLDKDDPESSDTETHHTRTPARAPAQVTDIETGDPGATHSSALDSSYASGDSDAQGVPLAVRVPPTHQRRKTHAPAHAPAPAAPRAPAPLRKGAVSRSSTASGAPAPAPAQAPADGSKKVVIGRSGRRRRSNAHRRKVWRPLPPIGGQPEDSGGADPEPGLVARLPPLDTDIRGVADPEGFSPASPSPRRAQAQSASVIVARRSLQQPPPQAVPLPVTLVKSGVKKKRRRSMHGASSLTAHGGSAGRRRSIAGDPALKRGSPRPSLAGTPSLT